MNKRTHFKKSNPEAYKAMLAFDAYSEGAAISIVHRDLLKIRASQLNGCAYCIDMHAKEARDHGETEQRIYALSAWRETPFFTEEERAVLALTEEATFISNRVADTTYENAVRLLGEKYVGDILMAVIVINAWNRIGVATNLAPVLAKVA